MKRKYLVSRILVATCALLTMPLIYAATPLWTFEPLTDTTTSVLANSTAIVQYQVTNQSRKTHHLVMTAIPGITQVTTAGNCSSLFNLAYQQSCILTLQVNGSSLLGNVVGGPVVCEEGSTLQCYQPSLADSLNITKNSALATTTLSVTKVTIPVNDGSGSLTITNTGTIYAASNVHAVLPSGWTGVVQDSSDCASIPPGSTCTITFTSTSPYNAQVGIVITGDNISSPPITSVAFSLSGYLVWDVSGSTAQVIASSDAVGSPQIWSVDFVTLPGINETSTTAGGDACNGATDGLCDTGQIVTHYSTPYANYAAGLCYEIISDNTGTVPVGTWYLPAVCQLGGSGQGASCSSSTPNINSNLFQQGFLPDFNNQFFWSSTESSVTPTGNAFDVFFALNNDTVAFIDARNTHNRVRCVRSVTF